MLNPSINEKINVDIKILESDLKIIEAALFIFSGTGGADSKIDETTSYIESSDLSDLTREMTIKQLESTKFKSPELAGGYAIYGSLCWSQTKLKEEIRFYFKNLKTDPSLTIDAFLKALKRK